jgi:hypothetical protein
MMAAQASAAANREIKERRVTVVSSRMMRD